MIARYEDLSPESLEPLDFEDATWASRTLQGMAGHDVPDTAYGVFLDVLTDALVGCADPDRAVANVARMADAAGNRRTLYALLAAYPTATRMLVTTVAASQFLANLLIANPEQFEILTNPPLRDPHRPIDDVWRDMERRVLIGKTPNARRDALRRFKATEVLRIGVRDVLGVTDMPETVSEISDFAECCVRMAFRISVEELGLTNPPFTVIGMGKLGAHELNYSSDIDLIFVHRDAEGFEPVRLAEKIRDSLARATDAGFVFRVDLRLRPEGRFGPITRSIDACRAYYESWAEPWERQALLKARPIAGDSSVGDDFATIRDEFVFGARVDDSFVESLRANKRRIEEKVARAGEAEINVKEGIGGVRDVEWSVQLLQLIAGYRNPDLRVPTTLVAIDRLTGARLLTESERRILAGGYVFTRTIEHRLQLMDELPIRCLPRNAGEMGKLARRVGYSDSAAFLAEYARITGEVNAVFKRLFYGDEPAVDDRSDVVPLLLAANDPKADQALLAHLADAGFSDPTAALVLLRRDVVGSEYGGIPPQARDAFAELLPKLFAAAPASGDPDAALRGIDLLAHAAPSRAALYRSLSESEDLLVRLCCIAGAAPGLWPQVIQHPDYLDLVADQEALEAEIEKPLDGDTIDSLGQSLARSRFFIGARDIWSEMDVAEVGGRLTRLAGQALDAALAIARGEIGFDAPLAVVGLGKLGGAELAYGSDLDVLYVSQAGALDDAARVVKRLQTILHDEIASHGVRIEVDPRLRPDGRKGPMVLDLESYRRYYATQALTWERQALIKASPIAGDPELGAAFAGLAGDFVFGRPFTPKDADAVRNMKRRIETERSRDANDIKLGPGGLSDIEWTTQILQLRHGAERPSIRTPGTLDALAALQGESLLSEPDWETLDTAYRELARTRNHRYLHDGVASDVAPALPSSLRGLMADVRSVFERLFVGSP